MYVYKCIPSMSLTLIGLVGVSMTMPEPCKYGWNHEKYVLAWAMETRSI